MAQFNQAYWGSSNDEEDIILGTVDTHLNKIVGFTVKDACENIRQATGVDLYMRVVEKNGEGLPFQEDYCPSRVNVAVNGDMISQFKFMG